MKLLKQQILFCHTSVYNFSKQKKYKYRPYNFLYSRLITYQPSSIRGACRQLWQSGDLDHTVKNNRTYYRLTSNGREHLKQYFAVFKTQSKPEMHPYLLITSEDLGSFIKEPLMEKFATLYKHLSKLGWRRLNQGTWLGYDISSQPVRKCLKQNNLGRSVMVFSVNKLAVGDFQFLCHYLWSLDTLSEEYMKFITQCQGLLKAIKVKKTLTKQEKTIYAKLLEQYFFLLKEDPALPEKLSHYRWPRLRAQNTFISLSRELEKQNV